MQIKKTRIFNPYKDTATARNCTMTATGSGAYIIYQKNKAGDLIPVYVGKSHTDIKKTLYRHFQQWNDNRNQYKRAAEPYERVTFYPFSKADNEKTYIKVIFTKTKKAADLLEYHFINSLKPKYNTLKMHFFAEMDIKETLKSYNETPAVSVTTFEEDPF